MFHPVYMAVGKFPKDSHHRLSLLTWYLPQYHLAAMLIDQLDYQHGSLHLLPYRHVASCHQVAVQYSFLLKLAALGTPNEIMRVSACPNTSSGQLSLGRYNTPS